MRWPFSPKNPQKSPDYADEKEYDYIIIGGGTSGCVLASHLSSSTTHKILLLERGPANDTYLSRIPLLSSNVYDPSSGAKSWFCAPMKHCNDRVNNEVYTRETKGDYEGWKEMGCEGWGWEGVEPYFQRMEKVVREDAKEAEERGRGTQGHWIMKAFGFTDTADKMGFSQIPDTNVKNASVDGLAMIYNTVTEDRKRSSTFHSFLPREITLEREKHLTICTNTTVHRIEFSDDDGIPRASKVIFGSSDSKSTKIFEAKWHWPSSTSRRTRYQSHPRPTWSWFQFHRPSKYPRGWEIPISESIIQVAVSPIKAILELAKYLLFGIGIMSLPSQTLSFFIRSQSLNEDATGPLIKDSSSPNLEPAPTEASPLHPFKPQNQVPGIELIPLARATYILIPHSHPAVDFGIFSNPDDRILARRAVHLALAFGKTMLASGFPLLRPVTFSSESQDLDVEHGDHEEMDNFIRHRVRNTFHYSSTCRMGSEADENAPGVVDNEFCVHGVKGVRIADASVFPKIVSHHTMAPTAMLATRCAGFLVDAQKNS
ncbi:hypothetical protein EAF00_002900 [Botryotinia globosa]|nr:hypothetical protein EAF00_002900 [Botryotinia globosa]